MAKKKSKPIELRPYTYKAEVTKVYDGDTITVTLDLGLGIKQEGVVLRLSRIDAYEVTRRKGVSDEDKAKGIEGRDVLSTLIWRREIIVQTSLDKKKAKGSFGRVLAEVFFPNKNGYHNANDEMVTRGYAVYKEY